MRTLSMVSGGVVVAATAALVLGVRIMGKNGAPGFLGPGTLAADINLMLEIVLVLGLTAGAFMARAGNIEAHRRNQTTWVLMNAVLVALIMVSSMQDVEIKSIADLAGALYWVTWLHALVGTLTVMAGLWLVLQMNDILPRRWHIGWWRSLMRLTLAGYWAVVLLGGATYYVWYIA